MDRRSFLGSLIAVGCTWLMSRPFRAWADTAGKAATTAEQGDAIRQAALKYLASLRPELRERAAFPFPKGQSATIAEFPSGRGSFKYVGERFGQSMWTNFPVSDVPRPGLRMGELSTGEREAFHNLLRVVLSPMGYQKVLDIMAADQVIADGGVPYAAGLTAYTAALFGTPDATEPWMLQLGGHHLGLNVIFVGDQAVCAPLHLGILPSKFQVGDRTVRALGRESDKAFELIGSLPPQQLKDATIDHKVSDLVFGPGYPQATLAPQGVRGADLNDSQRSILFDIISQWAGILNDAHAGPRLADIRQSLSDTRFAWSGPTTHEPDENGTAYFRVHGPSVLIEFAPQGNQGGYKKHVHTVMRDLKNDYARQLLT